jgi:hypothetical protein
VFPGGSAAVALRVVPGDVATAATANASSNDLVTQRQDDFGVAAIFPSRIGVDLMIPPLRVT